MKIVQALGWYYPDSLGGTEVYVEALARRLRAAGHEVLIAAPDPAADSERTYQYNNLPVYRYPIPLNATRDECQGARRVRGAERFHRWLAACRPDIVHIHTFVTGLALHEVAAAKAAGARVVVTTHAGSLGYVCMRGTMMRWGERLCDGVAEPAKCAACVLQHRGLPKALATMLGAIPPTLGHALAPIRGKLGTALSLSDLIVRNQARQRQLLETVDKFVVLTAWALEAVVANGGPREKLSLNCLGLSQSSVPKKPGPGGRPSCLPISIGYVGRFDPIKGVYDLARALKSLPAAVPFRAEFRGPASGDSERHILERLRELVGEDPRITFGAPVPSTDVPDLLASYDVVCCPSVCLEGGPTVAIEAHAVGTPVIGSDIGGLAELITDGVNGRLVVPGDWKALAAVIRGVAEDPVGTIDVWRTALPPARTMDDVASDYLDLYAGRRRAA